MSLGPRIIVALDFANQKDAFELVDQLDPSQCRLKVGKEMFTHFGPNFVKQLIDRDFDVFLDLKFHDIPNTVSKACLAAAELGVWMVNVHTSGGQKMMETTAKSLEVFGSERPLLIGVTVLTSMTESELKSIGVEESLEQHVLRLAALAQKSGLDGVVCSAHEAAGLKSNLGKDFSLVTPGIRLASANADDQSRIMTPEQAIKAGSDYLVIGRPITQASNPLTALCDISESVSQVL
ncbi:MAG: orotidine-5'-phosphate decarboxylase [Gammaproteobacteria bacterium]|nr:orotidine-5'-phosphate decarboxylase [Gammaproteobacteria bacterium]